MYTHVILTLKGIFLIGLISIVCNELTKQDLAETAFAGISGGATLTNKGQGETSFGGKSMSTLLKDCPEIRPVVKSNPNVVNKNIAVNMPNVPKPSTPNMYGR